MKKKWNLLIANNFYSSFNQNIELNFRTRSLKYFAGKKNPMNDISFNNKNKKPKEIYTGGTLNFSCDDKKKTLNLNLYLTKKIIQQIQIQIQEKIQKKKLKIRKKFI